MRFLIIIICTILSHSSLAQFKGAYTAENDTLSVQYFKFHSDGEYLMEKFEIMGVSITYYFNLNDLNGDEHIMLTTLNANDENDFLGDPVETKKFYTKASIQGLATYSGAIGNKEFIGYRDTMGYDIVKINTKDTINRFYYTLTDSDKQIVGILFNSDEMSYIPKFVEVQTKKGEQLKIKLTEFEETTEEVKIPEEEELGDFIEFSQLTAMMPIGGFRPN